MLSFREDILTPYIEDAKIIPTDYFFKKGMKRSDPVGSYDYDKADNIIYEISKSLKKEMRLFKTFGYLYHCCNENDVQKELGKRDEKNKIKPLKRETILTYKRKVIKFIHDKINGDQELKDEIIKVIKEEYEKAANKKRT